MLMINDLLIHSYIESQVMFVFIAISTSYLVISSKAEEIYVKLGIWWKSMMKGKVDLSLILSCVWGCQVKIGLLLRFLDGDVITTGINFRNACSWCLFEHINSSIQPMDLFLSLQRYWTLVISLHTLLL